MNVLQANIAALLGREEGDGAGGGEAVLGVARVCRQVRQVLPRTVLRHPDSESEKVARYTSVHIQLFSSNAFYYFQSIGQKCLTEQPTQDQLVFRALYRVRQCCPVGPGATPVWRPALSSPAAAAPPPSSRPASPRCTAAARAPAGPVWLAAAGGIRIGFLPSCPHTPLDNCVIVGQLVNESRLEHKADLPNPYGLLPRLNISQSVTPKLHTSDLRLNSPVWRYSVAIQAQGIIRRSVFL